MISTQPTVLVNTRPRQKYSVNNMSQFYIGWVWPQLKLSIIFQSQNIKTNRFSSQLSPSLFVWLIRLLSYISSQKWFKYYYQFLIRWHRFNKLLRFDLFIGDHQIVLSLCCHQRTNVFKSSQLQLIKIPNIQL